VKLKILVFPCGSEIGLEIFNSLNSIKNIELFGASSVDDNGKFVFQNYFGNIPMLHEKNFIDSIKNLVSKNKIDYIYPCMDIAILKLKQHEKEIGCKIISSPIETVIIASRKSLTYSKLKNIIRTPKILSPEKPEFPMFSKPDVGSSSRNTLKVNDPLDLQYSRKLYPENLLLEFLPGEEFTVDCFTDRNRKLLFIGPRKRKRISNGISVGTEEIVDIKITEIAHKINNSMIFSGSWFFQLKKDKNEEYCLLEIACRFGGSSVLNRIKGVNFSHLSLLNEFQNVQILKNNYDVEIGRSLDIKCKSKLEYSKVYIDFDDTIIINNEVNLDAIRFLYDCFNRGVKIILITKHKYPIKETLKKFKIHESLFHSIIQIQHSDSKFNYIESQESIFIDDSFKELMDVNKNLNIPVISVENIKHL